MTQRKNKQGAQFCSQTATIRYWEEQVTTLLQEDERPPGQRRVPQEAWRTLNLFPEWRQAWNAELEILCHQVCLLNKDLPQMAF